MLVWKWIRWRERRCRSSWGRWRPSQRAAITASGNRCSWKGSGWTWVGPLPTQRPRGRLPRPAHPVTPITPCLPPGRRRPRYLSGLRSDLLPPTTYPGHNRLIGYLTHRYHLSFYRACVLPFVTKPSDLEVRHRAIYLTHNSPNYLEWNST